ncbi:MAG TPA: hypothetical protein VFS22_08620 [Flavisolibacter sp.]|nr:hypothetical protein [Flavisolibacter sp.]
MKQILPVLSVTLLSIVLLAGCRKNNEQGFTIEGIVLHHVTRKPIAHETLLIAVSDEQRIGPPSIEFPNGQYSSVTREFTAVSDANGRYSIHITHSGYPFPRIRLNDHKYIMVYAVRARQEVVLNDSTIMYAPPGPTIFDTLYLESPAFVKYTIKNLSPGFDDDTLFVRTPWQRKTVGYELASKDTGFYIHRLLQIGAFNWMMTGKSVDTTIIDTIPGESNVHPEVLIFSKRTDTALYKKEALTIHPNTTVNYNIEY